jgi:hypothetical protein
MDRALIGDDHLIVFLLQFIVSWFFTLNFTFIRAIAQRLALGV